MKEYILTALTDALNKVTDTRNKDKNEIEDSLLELQNPDLIFNKNK